MACSQTLSGIINDCSPSMGGIVEVLVANHSDVTAVTAANGVISAITMASSAVFYKYELPRNTASLTSSYNIDNAAGSKYVESNLVIVLNAMTAIKRAEITALAEGEFAAIAKDANGIYWYLGMDAPVVAAEGTGESGTARADRNGYSITLQDNSKEMPNTVSATIISTLLGED